MTDFISRQLEATYTRIQADEENSARLRNWCVTVWIGAIALVSAKEVALLPIQKTLLPVLPIIFFWVLDALEHVFIFVHRDSARQLERWLLIGAPEDAADLLKHSLEHRIPSIPYRRKLLSFLRNMFLIETVTLFYGALLGVTLLLNYLSREA